MTLGRIISLLFRFASLAIVFAGLAHGSIRADDPAKDAQRESGKANEAQPLSQFKAKDPVAVAFSADGSELFVFESGFTPRFLRFETKSGKLKSESPLEFSYDAIAFSADLKQSLISGPFGRLDVCEFDGPKGDPFVSKRRLGEFVYAIRSAAFSADGKWFATGGEDRTVNLWDAGGSKVVKKQRVPNHPDRVVQFSPDDKRLLAVAEDGVYVFGVPELDVAFRLRRETKKVRYSGATFTKDAGGIFAWQSDGLVERWRLSDGKMIGTIKPPGFEPFITDVLAPTADGRIFVAVNFGGVYSYDSEEGPPVEVVPKAYHTGGLGTLVMSRDNKLLCLVSGNGGTVWDIGRLAGKR